MSRAGKLLIAHPNLPATNPFYKSVIYIFDDGPDGTQGLILNKPSDFRITDFFRSKGFELPIIKETMRFGGPIKTNMVVMLHSDGWYSSSTSYTRNGISLSCDDLMLQKICIGDFPTYYRMFMGVSTWRPGQLDAELQGIQPYKSENSWLIAEADPNIIFDYDSQRQWDKAVSRSSQEMINNYF